MVLSSFGSMMRKEEHFKISGSTWVIGAAFLCSILFSKYPYISFMVLSLFILGDASAALVGIGIGRIKIGKKSLEGSLACLTVCLLLFYLVFPIVPGLMDDVKMPTLLIWAVSLVITVFELIPLRVSHSLVLNDNIAVPVIAGYSMLLLEKIM
jgi:dolichol kinase